MQNYLNKPKLFLPKLFLIAFFMLLTGSILAQGSENCANGIDDDADGLVDLNDPDCDCPPLQNNNVTSLIPNPSFENSSCCPSSISQFNCADDWIQASVGTSDYFNTCGFLGTSAITPGNLANTIPNGGNAFGGFINFSGRADYTEFIGACLTAPMTAGTSYTLEYYLGFGASSNSYPYTSPTNVAIYATTDCNDIPFAGNDCPPANFDMIATATVSGAEETWVPVSFTFTAAQNYTTIMIGAVCQPGTTGGTGDTESYYFVDELIFNETTEFGTITASGDCDTGFSLTAASDAGIVAYQWYEAGVAISGATSATYTVPNGDYGMFQVVATYDSGTCGSAEVEVIDCGCTVLAASAITQTGDCCTGYALEVAVDGQIITDYQWFLDGFPISGATAATYNVPVEDSGTYSVEVNFDDGSCGTTELIVDACFPPLDPVLIDDLVEVCEGTTAQFVLDTATITDTNVDTFYWFNTTPNMPTDIGTEIATGTSFTPTDTAPGSYTYCVATASILGTADTSRCYSNPTCMTLEIYALPATPILVNDTIEICRGETVQFELDAASIGNPNTDTFYWFDTTPTNLPTDLASAIATGTSLTPPDTDSGFYTYCVVGESLNGANNTPCYSTPTCAIFILQGDCCSSTSGMLEAEFSCPSSIDLDGVDNGLGQDLNFPTMTGFMGDIGTQQLPNYHTYLLVVEAGTGDIIDAVLVAYTDSLGTLVDARPISIPYAAFQAYPNGTGMDYQFYLYNFSIDNPPANANLPMGIQVPLPTGASSGIATNITTITIPESPTEACYSLSYFNETYIPNPLMQTCNEQVDEGNNGGALPTYYNTRTFCISGGSPPYDFTWHTVGYVRNAIMYTNGDEAGMQVEYTDNATWECIVTDNNGCTTGVWSFNNNGAINGGNDNPIVDITSETIEHDACLTRNTYEGSISIVVEGGSQWPNTNYEYVWSGPAQWDETGQGTATISNCAYGWYSVTVTEMTTGGLGDGIMMGDQTEGWFWVACQKIGSGRGKAALTTSLVNTYPNPLGSQATIEFGTPIATNARVSIHTIDGRELIELYNGSTEAQTIYNLAIDTQPLSSGIYILQMETTDGSLVNQRIVVTK